MKIHESIDDLSLIMGQVNDMLKLSEQSINLTLRALMQNATPEQMVTIQKQVKDIDGLFTKAKKGELI